MSCAQRAACGAAQQASDTLDHRTPGPANHAARLYHSLLQGKNSASIFYLTNCVWSSELMSAADQRQLQEASREEGRS